MAAKKAKETKGAKTTMKATKAKKIEGKAPAEAAAERRAEAVEALDGLAPEARAEAVEALEVEAAPAPAPAANAEAPGAPPAPAAPAEPNYGAQAASLLKELGFERTGEVVQEVRPRVLLSAAETWRDAKAPPDRDEACDVLARAGWFRTPAAASPPPIPAPEPAAAAPRAENPDIAALHTDVVEAKAGLEAAESEAKKVEEQAHAALAKAKERYRAALAPYRDACKVQGRACEFEGGGRGSSLSERVAFEVAVQGDQVRIAVKGKPETEERFPVETVRASPGKTAAAFTERHVGPKDVVGNKQGTLSNKLRAVLGANAAR